MSTQILSSTVPQTSYFTGTTPRPKHVEYFLKHLLSRQILRKEFEEFNKIYMLSKSMEYLAVIMKFLE